MRKSHRPKLAAALPETGDIRVGTYVRRSTDEEHQPYSIEAQDNSLNAYIESQPRWRLAKRFSDDASGANADRPGLQQALAAARAGVIDVLLVYRVDRFSRRLRDLVDLLDQLDTAKVVFRSATEPIDTSTPMGRMLLQLLGMFAEFERDVIIDRVVNGMERKAAAGRWRGGMRPYGYTPHPETGVLQINDDENPVVRAIYSAYTDERIGTRAIAKRLNDNGHRTAVGGPWSGHQVIRVLSNSVYTGEIVFRDITVPNAHEPIIDTDTFAVAQNIIAARGEDHTRRASNASDYLFTGKLRCPECGKSMIGTAATGRTKTYRYYTCFARARYGSKECSAPRLPADQVDTAVLAALRDFYANNTDLIAEAFAEAHKFHASHHADRISELDTVTAEITKTGNAIDRYFTAFENGTMNEEIAAPRLEQLGAKLKQLKQRRDELAEDIDTAPIMPTETEIADILTHIDQVIDRDQPAATKALIDALVARVKVVSATQLVPVFRVHHGHAGADDTPADEDDDPAPPSNPPHRADQAQDPVRAMGEVVGRLGLEPRTYGLKVRSSTN